MQAQGTGRIYHGRFLDHLTGAGHPESPARLHALVRGLRESGLWDKLVPLSFGEIDPAWVERVHDPAYVARFRDACIAAAPSAALDTPDCQLGKDSYEIALLAAGGTLAAVDAVMAGRVRNAFCALRPPGHHAEFNEAKGFCFFNTPAIAAEYLLREHGLKRVAVVDFDVHHGNGVQHIFDARPEVLALSVHETPETLFPGSGFAEETGIGAGTGTTVNAPLPPGSGDAEYRAVFEQILIPALDKYRPEFVLAPVGFDGLASDPLAHHSLSAEAYGWMTDQVCAAAERHAGGRLVSLLEGGYNLDTFPQAAVRHVEALLRNAGG